MGCGGCKKFCRLRSGCRGPTVVALVSDGRLLSSETSPPPAANLPPRSAARRQEPAARLAPDNRSLPAGLPPPRPTRAVKAGGQWRDCLTAWQSPRPPLFSASKGRNPSQCRCPSYLAGSRPAAVEFRAKIGQSLIRD